MDSKIGNEPKATSKGKDGEIPEEPQATSKGVDGSIPEEASTTSKVGSSVDMDAFLAGLLARGLSGEDILEQVRARLPKRKEENMSVKDTCLAKSLDSKVKQTNSLIRLLQDQLLGLELIPVQSDTYATLEKLEMKHIFVKKGPTANALESSLLFLLLHKDTKKVEDLDLRALWNKIQEAGLLWLDQMSEDERNVFEINGETGKVFQDKTELILRGGKSRVKVTSLEHIDLQTNYVKAPRIILLIDKDIEQLSGYFSLDASEETCISIKSSIAERPFHAAVSLEEPVTDLEYGSFMRIEPVTLPKSVDFCRLGGNNGVSSVRPFDEESKRYSYTEGFTLDCTESGATTSLVKHPCHELKLLRQETSEEDQISKFVRETFRFATGCINSRVNGTIHFGIADEKVDEAWKFGRQPREIVGVIVKDKITYNNKLEQYFKVCFPPEDLTIASHCIHRPEFVLIESKTGSSSDSLKYVIEVDIEPVSELTEGKLIGVKIPSSSGKIPSKPEYYERRGAETTHIAYDRLPLITRELRNLDELRKREEWTSRKQEKKGVRLGTTRKLKRLLGVQNDELDDSFHRVLVLSKFPDAMRQREQEYRDTLSCLKTIPWTAVLDFNTEGFDVEAGPCSIMTEDTNFDKHDAEDYETSKACLDHALDNPQWCFVNGCNTAYENQSPLDWSEWQTSGRKRGLDKLIIKLAEDFPPGRLIIFFLILPGSTDIESLTFGQFRTYTSPNQLMFFVEDMLQYGKWVNSIAHKYKYVNEQKAEERGVSGLSWQEFQQVIFTIKGLQRGKLYTPISPDTLGIVKGNCFNERLLTIINCKECHDLGESEETSGISDQVQMKFYQGGTVHWKNFWYNHVVERDAVLHLEELLVDITSRQEDDGIVKRVCVVKLFASRGAGGSTTAKHLLWRLSQRRPYKYRCCQLNCITEKSTEEILRLLNTMNSSCLPLLVLVDDENDLPFDQLRENLSDGMAASQYNAETNRKLIILLHVKQSTDPRNACSTYRNESTYVDYQLTENEYKQFKCKYNELEKKYKDKYPGDDFVTYADKNLVTFMILLKPEDEKRAYTTTLVNQTIPNLADHEKKTLTYLSLLHIYVPFHVFLACFDSVMCAPFSKWNRHTYTVNWKSTITPDMRKFLREKSIVVHCGTGVAIAISHPFIAEAILQYMSDYHSKSIGEITLEFLSSDLFKPMIKVPFPVSHLWRTTNVILKERKTFQRRGRSQVKSDFSPLIEKILHHENTTTRGKFVVTRENLEMAEAVLSKGHSLFHDPVLAQHIARLFYIHGPSVRDCNNDDCFRKAEEYALEALKIKQDNSYFMDTVGRIGKSELLCQFGKIRSNYEEMSLEMCSEAVTLSKKAIKWFRKSQDMDAQKCGHLNNAGYFGEISVIFLLLDLLSCCECFRRERRNFGYLQKYLTEMDFIPEALESWDMETHRFLKDCENRSQTCMARIEEIFSIFKGRSSEQADDDKAFNYEKQLEEFKDSHTEFFAHSLYGEVLPATWKGNWIKHNRLLHGQLFYDAFNIHKRLKLEISDKRNIEKLKELKDIADKNAEIAMEKEVKVVFCKTILSMALHSPYKRILPRSEAIAEYKYIRECVQWLNTHSANDRGTYKMYAYLFNVMFKWPHEKEEMCCGDGHSFREALVGLKTAVNDQRERTSEENAEVTLYPHLNIRKQRSNTTTLFYLGKGWGLDVFVHINELQRHKCSWEGINWQHPDVRKRLQRTKGMQVADHMIEMLHPIDQTKINVSIAKSFERASFSRQLVDFYLGFSWTGPVAYDVKQHINEMQAIRSVAFDADNEPDDGISMTMGEYQEQMIRLNREFNLCNDKRQKHRIQMQINELKKKIPRREERQ